MYDIINYKVAFIDFRLPGDHPEIKKYNIEIRKLEKTQTGVLYKFIFRCYIIPNENEADYNHDHKYELVDIIDMISNCGRGLDEWVNHESRKDVKLFITDVKLDTRASSSDTDTIKHFHIGRFKSHEWTYSECPLVLEYHLVLEYDKDIDTEYIYDYLNTMPLDKVQYKQKLSNDNLWCIGLDFLFNRE